MGSPARTLWNRGSSSPGVEQVSGHCQLEQSEGDFRRFASAIHQVACDV